MKENIKSLIQDRLDRNRQLPCDAAHAVAKKGGIEPSIVREQADSLDIRISRCQLGLFGYAEKKGMPGFRAVKESVNQVGQVPEGMANAVNQAAVDRKLSCSVLWEIAQDWNVSRFETGCITEILGLKVHGCQLGCF